MTQAADDLLDRHAVPGERHDCRICFLAPQIALVPQLFCRGEQLWGDCRRADGAADAAWTCAPRRGKPNWRSPSNASGRRPGRRRAAPWRSPHHNRRHDRGIRFDPGMIGEPGPNRSDLQSGNNVTIRRRSIADNSSVAAIASKGPIVDADNGQRIGSLGCPASDNPKQRIVADRQRQPFGETRCWSAAECQPQMVDDAF